MANSFAAEIARVQETIRITQANIARDQALLASDPTNTTLITQIASGQAYLVDLDAQLAFFNTAEAASTASAGAVVSEAAAARDDNANSQNPQAAQVLIVPAGRVNQNLETGTNGEVRTLTQTQATPPSSAPFAPNDEEGNPLPPTASLNAGVGAGNEDSGNTKNATRTEIDNVFGDKMIVPQSNVLDQYSSYTYSASVYLMKPEALAQMIKSGKKTIAGSQLLFQSGGAPVGGRNPYFKDDYYIDKIQLKSSIAGKGSGASHNVNTISMTVIEPTGITLLKNLDLAVSQYLGTVGNPPKKKSFQAQLYLLVIRFYGYDDAGNLVQAGITGPGGGTSATPGSAFVEKYYPMCINTIKFKVANKLVEYEIEASSPKYQMNTGQMRGSIPYNIELSAMTVKDALSGTAVIEQGQSQIQTITTTRVSAAQSNIDPGTLEGMSEADVANTNIPPAPPKASTAPSPKLTIRKGLIEALNQFQLELVARGEYTYPDVYSIEYVTSSIEQATLKRPGGDKKNDGMAAPNSAKTLKDPNTQSTDSTARIISVTAGTQLVQVIDKILKSCSYIEDQQLVKILEDTQEQVKNGSPGRNLAWYKISLEAIPGKYDPKRNDYAYTMKYIIHPYKITEMRSNYFQTPAFNGVHKQYNYWFTGENTQVLSYEQTYNSLYTSILSGGPQSPYTEQSDTIKYTWQTRSNENSQGAAGRTNEPSANAADYLYNPSDLAIANLTIVGDPAWLQQGEAFATPARNNFNFNPFLADGTINYDATEILFEVLINTPQDYNFETGIMDPNQRAVINSSAKQPGSSKQSYVYHANTIVSDFVKGKFTQQLNGSLRTYFRDQTLKAAQDSGRPTTNNITADTVRTNTNTANSPDYINQQGGEGGYSASSNTTDSPDYANQQDVLSGPATPLPSPPPGDPTSTGGIIAGTDTPAPQDASVPDKVLANADETAAVNAYVAAGGTFPRGTGPITSGPLFDGVLAAKAALTARQQAAAQSATTTASPQNMNREA